MSLEDYPSYLSDFLDINLGTAEIILSIIVIMAIVLPVMMLAKGKHLLPTFISFLLAMVLCVGLGWLDSWILIFTVAIVSLGLAYFGSGVVAGK